MEEKKFKGLENKILTKDTMDGYSYNGSTPNYAQEGIYPFSQSNGKDSETYLHNKETYTSCKEAKKMKILFFFGIGLVALGLMWFLARWLFIITLAVLIIGFLVKIFFKFNVILPPTFKQDFPDDKRDESDERIR
jgi:hypothetical protein